MRLDKDYICSSDGSKPQLGTGFMSILASNLYLQLQMNSISGLVEFFEDEIVAKPMPSKVILDNLQIQLQVIFLFSPFPSKILLDFASTGNFGMLFTVFFQQCI